MARHKPKKLFLRLAWSNGRLTASNVPKISAVKYDRSGGSGLESFCAFFTVFHLIICWLIVSCFFFCCNFCVQWELYVYSVYQWSSNKPKTCLKCGIMWPPSWSCNKYRYSRSNLTLRADPLKVNFSFCRQMTAVNFYSTFIAPLFNDIWQKFQYNPSSCLGDMAT